MKHSNMLTLRGLVNQIGLTPTNLATPRIPHVINQLTPSQLHNANFSTTSSSKSDGNPEGNTQDTKSKTQNKGVTSGKTPSKASKHSFETHTSLEHQPIEDVANRIVAEGPAHLRQATEDLAVGHDAITRDIEDPQLRERIMIVEKQSQRLEKAKLKRIQSILNSKAAPAAKIQQLIAIEAPSETIINAMHNILPRVTSFNARHRPNIDNLDPIRYSRDWLEEDFNPSGYDVENSSDPDTLPQQRSFTREELHRVLQDVEASKHCETDLEDQLILPLVMMDQVNREVIKQDLQRGLDSVLGEVPAQQDASAAQDDGEEETVDVPLSDITPEVSVQDYGFEDSGMPLMLALDQEAREVDPEARVSPKDAPKVPFVSSSKAQLAAQTFAGYLADPHMRAGVGAVGGAGAGAATEATEAGVEGGMGSGSGYATNTNSGSPLVGLPEADRDAIVQQHNASAIQLRGDDAAGVNKAFEVDSIIDLELSEKLSSKSAALTQNGIFNGPRGAPRDPRVLGRVKQNAEQEATIITDMILSEADWHDVAKNNLDEIRTQIQKLSQDEADSLLRAASSLTPSEFKAKVTELAASMQKIQELAFDADRNEYFGEPKEDAGKIASKYAKDKAEKAQPPLIERFPQLSEFDDDDDRHESASEYEGPHLADTPGMTIQNARHMLENMVHQDVWARYYDSRPSAKYYQPVVLNADVDTLASDDDPGVVNKMPHNYPETYLPSLAVRVVQRAQAVIAQKVASPKKMRRIRAGLLRYTDLPPALVNAITMNKQTPFDDDTPLSPKLRKEIDEAAFRWLSKRRERKPLATKDEVLGLTPEQQTVLAQKRGNGDDTFSDDALDVSQRVPLDGEKVRNYLTAVATKHGLPIPQATLDSDAYSRIYNKSYDGADENFADVSGTDFDTDMDEMIGDIAAEMSATADVNTNPKTFKEQEATEDERAELEQPVDVEELEAEAEGDSESEARIAALQISQAQTETLVNMVKEALARKTGEGQVGEEESKGFNSLEDVMRAEGREGDMMRQLVAQLRQEQANALRRLYALNPEYARSLVAKASLETMTPGQYAVARASQLFGEDEQKSEDEDPAETELKAFRKSAENHLLGDFEKDPTLPESVKKGLREAQQSGLRRDELDEEEAARLKAQATGFDFTKALAEYEHAAYQLSLQQANAEKSESSSSTSSSEDTSDSTDDYVPFPRPGIKSVAEPVVAPIRSGSMAPVFVDSFFDMASSEALSYASNGAITSIPPKTKNSAPRVSDLIPEDATRESSTHVLGLLNYEGLTPQQVARKNALRYSELEKREAEIRAAIQEQMNPAEEEDDTNDQLEAVSDEESLKMIVGEEEEDEEKDASQDETEILAPYRSQELYQMTPMRVPNAARDLQKDVSMRDINVLADIQSRELKRKFFEGILPGDEYNFLLANNRETEFNLGLDTGENGKGAADLRKYRRELLLQGRTARAEYEERLNEYEDSPSVRTEPEINSKYQLDDHDEHLMTRRIQPYDLSEPGFSHIPPIIGIEQQTNLYNLHKLDPVTFHPRWIARRLNIEPAYVIGMLKAMDLLQKSQVWAHQMIARVPGESAGDVSLDAGENAASDQVEVTPAELHLEESDEEFVYGGELPFMIGKVSWDDSIYRDPAWQAEPWADLVWYSDSDARDIRAEEQRRHRRWASKQQKQDAIERASFARFGPVHWASGRNTVHRPPKLPREIISTTIFPPSRHNWILTDLSEAKSSSTFAISVRDKDGYLRHPTFREFKNVRYRERDHRLPFSLREYEVVSKLPEISSLYVSQLAALRDNIEIVKPVIPPTRSTDNPFTLDAADGSNEEDFDGEQAVPIEGGAESATTAAPRR